MAPGGPGVVLDGGEHAAVVVVDNPAEPKRDTGAVRCDRTRLVEEATRHLLNGGQRRRQLRFADGFRRLPAHPVIVDKRAGHVTPTDVDGDAQH